MVTVAGVLLARVAGVSARRLDALAQPQTLAALGEAEAAGERAAELAPALEDVLRDLVPSPALNRTLRRAVLALKRDVHNGRPPAGSLDAISSLVGPELVSWLRAVTRGRDARAAAEERLEAELARAGDALLAAVADPELANGLALASPDLVERLAGGRTAAAARPESRLARSCVTYLARAGVKTSPFSTFTQVALAGFGHAAAASGDRRSVTLVSRALATDLLHACATDRRLAGALRFASASGVVREPWPPRLVTPRYTWLDGFAWRHDGVTEVGVYERLMAVVARVPEGGHADYLAALGGRDPHAAFARMVATGMVRPVAPWSRTDPRPLGALARALDGAAGEIAAVLREIEAAADRIALAPPRQRTTALRELRARAVAAYAATSRPAPAWVREAPLAHEDVAPPVAPPPLPDAVRDELARLGDRMRPHVVRSRIYDELVAHLVARHGAGGRCDDVLRFLLGFMARPDSGAVLGAASRADWSAATSGADASGTAPVGASSAPPAASVFFQLAAADERALERGEFLLVPNQHNPGLGALLARYLPLHGERLAEPLRAWLHDLYPDALVVELPAAADWNDLQHGGAGIVPPLAWPGALPTSDLEPPLRLADLALTHDAATDTLTLATRDGRPVAPVYLGTVPPHLVLGPLRLLLALADPWIVGQPEGSAWTEARQRRPPPTEVEQQAREVDGRLVTRRARWRVPAAAFPVRGPDEARLDHLARADRWRRAHGIPVEVFATVARGGPPSLRAKDRKPLWVRFDSLHALDVAGRTVDAGALWVDLVESLPGPGERWLRDAAGEPRAVEFVSLLRWPRPIARNRRAGRRAEAEVLVP